MITFSLAMLVLAVTPGPGVFATVASALSSGFKQTLLLIAGIVMGDLIYLLFAVFGLSYIAQTMAEVFTLFKYIGGAYLVYLGIQIWRTEPSLHLNRAETAPVSGAKKFISGLLITLSNPKVILFYCGFLPTFIDLTNLSQTDIATIALLVTLVLGTVLSVYSYAAGRSRQLFQTPAAMRSLHRSAGSIMAATGVAIAIKS